MTCTHVSVGPPSVSMWSFPGSKTYWGRCEAKKNLANITVKSAVTFLTLIWRTKVDPLAPVYNLNHSAQSIAMSSSSCFTVSSSYLFLLFNSFWKKLLGALLPLTGLQCGTEWLYPRPLMLSPQCDRQTYSSYNQLNQTMTHHFTPASLFCSGHQFMCVRVLNCLKNGKVIQKMCNYDMCKIEENIVHVVFLDPKGSSLIPLRFLRFL